MSELIERLAREARFYETEMKGWSPQLEAFAKAVARECIGVMFADTDNMHEEHHHITKEIISDAIKERFGL